MKKLNLLNNKYRPKISFWYREKSKGCELSIYVQFFNEPLYSLDQKNPLCSIKLRLIVTATNEHVPWSSDW